MIYEYPTLSDPIRQGDIFIGLPRIDLSLSRVLVVKEDEPVEMSWSDISKSGEPVTALVGVRPVAAIVASQDCDVTNGRDVTLCEIREFRQVEGKAKETKTAKSWKNIITQHARINLKWFYLPPDVKVGFAEKMGVDFMITLRVPRADLNSLLSLRKGRLNSIADEHFRERLSEFYRRYPYDEWYGLDKDELKTYVEDYPDITPFPWQAQ
ncbi:MAG: hypothetical protein HRU82_09770 [Nitrospira sp.]|nr:MAG: hypothetical protein HRU82_09770 [Nitrospira sp.]